MIWFIIPLVIIPTLLYAIFVSQIEYSPLSVEILGTLSGILIAISFAEMVKIVDKESKAAEFKTILIEDIKRCLELLDGEKIRVSTYIWDMGIADGIISTLDKKLREYAWRFYNALSLYNDYILYSSIQMTTAPTIRKEIFKLIRGMIETAQTIGKAILDEYSSLTELANQKT